MLSSQVDRDRPDPQAEPWPGAAGTVAQVQGHSPPPVTDTGLSRHGTQGRNVGVWEVTVGCKGQEPQAHLGVTRT